MLRETWSRLTVTFVAALATAAVAVGCGSSSSSSSSTSSASSPASASSSTASPSSSTSSPVAGGGGTQVTVFAAASLSKVFPMIAPGARFTFAGSDSLQRQIEQGAPADVFAAASTKQPDALYAKGLVDKPTVFATNLLVLVVPENNPAHITSVDDITKPGVKLVICAATVPCGDYARNAFKALGITTAAMKNVVSETTDVTQVLAQVAVGQADAGFVYITDAKTAPGKVKVIKLPAKAKPNATDSIAVVKAGMNQAGAKAFVARVLSPQGQAMLKAAGFGAP